MGRSHSKTSCCLKSKNIALFDTILLNLTVPVDLVKSIMYRDWINTPC
ncbi:hypothetical protein [Candidatus Tisiphia endosymbiont of Neophilaenus lineatus]